jgi:CRP-like cAMP-binding protein
MWRHYVLLALQRFFHRRQCWMGETAQMADYSPTNTILATLDNDDRRVFATELEVNTLAPHTEMYVTNGTIEQVYFPLSLVASTMIGTAALASIGNEGMLGFELVLGIEQTVGRTVVQVAGRALRMNARRFCAQLEQSPRLARVVRSYVGVVIRRLLISGACHRTHNIEQRCARLLLQMHDRVGNDSFTLTQQFFGEMMGVRRATVNPALVDLKTRGLIDYTRGRITIRDRTGLGSAACDCYRTMRLASERLTEAAGS